MIVIFQVAPLVPRACHAERAGAGELARALSVGEGTQGTDPPALEPRLGAPPSLFLQSAFQIRLSSATTCLRSLCGTFARMFLRKWIQQRSCSARGRKRCLASLGKASSGNPLTPAVTTCKRPQLDEV